MSDKYVEISTKLLKWLSASTTEAFNFKELRDTFLYGNTLEESIALVMKLISLSNNNSGLDFQIELSNGSTRKPIIEILPHPTPEEIKEAKAKLLELGISESSISTSDLYLENPKRANKDLLIFMLGE